MTQKEKLIQIIKNIVLDIKEAHYFNLITIDAFSESYAQEIIKAFPQITKKPVKCYPRDTKKENHRYDLDLDSYSFQIKDERQEWIDSHYVEVCF